MSAREGQPAAPEAYALTDSQRDWLHAGAAWSNGTNGKRIEEQFDSLLALVAEQEEQIREQEEHPCPWEPRCKAAERDAATLREALADEVAMGEQSAETLRDLHRNWQRYSEETTPDGDEPLLRNMLYWLIEDVIPAEAARAALAAAAPADEPAVEHCVECGRAGDPSVLPGAYDEECPVGAPCHDRGGFVDDGDESAAARADEPAASWVCRRAHPNCEPRLVPAGEECPACGADEPAGDA